jgi:hypothetical protein
VVYSSDPTGQYWNRSWNSFDPATLYLVGNHSFTFVPGASKAVFWLNSIATASSNQSTPRIHSKTETSTYNYIGRSFGVGSSVGLANTSSPVAAPYLGYTYNETGYKTQVTCAYNDSSNWQLSLVEETDSFPAPGMRKSILGNGVIVISFNRRFVCRG